MDRSWTFDQPPNCGVITLRQVMEHGKPILLVSHDEDDHGWQFLDGSERPDEADAVLVCLSHVVETDPTVIELADLPPGWQAWQQSPQEKWVREPCFEGGNEASVLTCQSTRTHNSRRPLRRKLLRPGHLYDKAHQ